MVKISLIQAFRHLYKQKFFSILNILGLTLGLSATLWLVLFLQNELTYDKYHPNHERVYRVSHNFKAPGVEFNMAMSANELSPMLKERFPEIESYARFRGLVIPEIEIGDQLFEQEHMYYTDPGAFDVFRIQLTVGNPNEQLKTPNTIMLAESVHNKVFGNSSGLGRTIRVDGNDMIVTGVFMDLPDNTHFQFKALLTGVRERDWIIGEDGSFNSEVLWNPDCVSYLLFANGSSIPAFEEKFKAFDEEFFAPFGNVVNGKHTMYLQRLDEIHYSELSFDNDSPKGNRANLVVFSSIGIAILLLACINYINLATAQAGLRAKEIGVRKVLGSDMLRLRIGLLAESMIQVFIAFGLSLVAVWALINHSPLQSWLGVTFQFDLFEKTQLLGLSIIIVICTGILAGAYPAFYISKIQTIRALKGKGVTGKGGHWLRQTLVSFQFIISIGVLTATLLMQDQISFMQNRSMGFDQDQVMLVNLRDSVAQTNYKVLKNRLEQSTAISSVTSSDFVPIEGVGDMVFRVEKDGEMQNQEFSFIIGDADYLNTLGIELAQGRFYDKSLDDNSQYFVVNELAAKMLGWEDPIGKKMGFFHQDDPGQIIGVVKDFNFSSLHNPIVPLAIVYSPNPGQNLIINFAQKREQETTEYLTEVWNEIIPNYPLDYRFLNESLKAQYDAEMVQNKLIGFMTILCIVISLIGLTGLTAFSIDQKRKEIGIRKVLGALSFQIVTLIYSNTLKLILISSVIAVPLTYYFIGQWSQSFEYQTAINLVLLVVGVLSALCLTFVLVSTFVIRTARKNPTESLRYE